MTNETKPESSRADIRAHIFGNKSEKFKSIQIEFFGEAVELRQPTLGQALEMQSIEDRKKAIVNTIINYCYVPGTNELVFDEADVEELMGLPFGKELQVMSNAISELTGVDLEEAEKN